MRPVWSGISDFSRLPRTLRVCGVIVVLLAFFAQPDGSVVAADAVSPAEADERARGASIYREHCIFCHGAHGEGYISDNAVALGGQDFLTTVSDEFLARSIANGRPGTWMEAFSKARGGPLGGGEIKAIVAFIRGWQREASVDFDSASVAGDAGKGRGLYATQCAECHGRVGQGVTAVSLNNPEYLAAVSNAQIRWAISRGRRGTPMPAYSEKLSSGDIDNLVALIRSWQP